MVPAALSDAETLHLYADQKHKPILFHFDGRCHATTSEDYLFYQHNSTGASNSDSWGFDFSGNLTKHISTSTVSGAVALTLPDLLAGGERLFFKFFQHSVKEELLNKQRTVNYDYPYPVTDPCEIFGGSFPQKLSHQHTVRGLFMSLYLVPHATRVPYL